MTKEILEITKRFHETYEKLSKEYSYETREDTKVFNVNSNNGMLMYATVNEIVSPILKENKQLKADYGNLAQVERDFLKEVIKEAREYNQKIVDDYLKENDCEYCDGRYATATHNLEILSKGENK